VLSTAGRAAPTILQRHVDDHTAVSLRATEQILCHETVI
jgi:hypothetical protein